MKFAAELIQKVWRKDPKPTRVRRIKDLLGGGDLWTTRDYFLRAKHRNVPGIPDARCFMLQSTLRGICDISGDVAECGVRFGKSAVFMLEADLAARTYHLFDSFEGLSEPSVEDIIKRSGSPYWEKGDIAAPEAEARANLAGFRGVTLYPGWIPDRFSEVKDHRFALVHIDVDLYEPTLASLEFFWPRLVSGGVVVCDDYGFQTCPGAARAVDRFVADNPAMLIEVTTGQALIFKR